jgi:hypothetical protein
MIWRLLIFLFTFSLEVRVRAELLQEPVRCLAEATVCAVRTGVADTGQIEVGSSAIAIDQSSSLIRLSANDAKLIWGTIWIKAKGDFTIRTEYGDASITDGEFWVTKTAERIIIATITSSVTVKPLGSNEHFVVESGEENWLSRVGRSGSAESGVPMAISFKEHLERWARLYRGGKKNFEKDVAEFHKTWLAASERTAQLHQSLVNRKIASIQEEKARLNAERRRRAAEDLKFREMFRRKVSGDDN